MMNIGDLDYLENASETSAIAGSAALNQVPDQVLLNLSGSNLILSFGAKELYRTNLPAVPSSTQLVFENLPGTKVTVSTKNTDGTIITSATATIGVGQDVSLFPISSFFSSFYPPLV